MRCLRCNKKLNRKHWKQFHNCIKCGYVKWVNISNWKHGFRTETYIVIVRSDCTYIYIKRSNRDIFVRHYDGYKEYNFDYGKYIGKLNKQISPKSNDDDINKYLMLK